MHKREFSSHPCKHPYIHIYVYNVNKSTVPLSVELMRLCLQAATSPEFIVLRQAQLTQMEVRGCLVCLITQRAASEAHWT